MGTQQVELEVHRPGDSSVLHCLFSVKQDSASTEGAQNVNNNAAGDHQEVLKIDGIQIEKIDEYYQIELVESDAEEPSRGRKRTRKPTSVQQVRTRSVRPRRCKNNPTVPPLGTVANENNTRKKKPSEKAQSIKPVDPGEKCFECDLCSYTTKTKWYLEKHMYIHADKLPFACDQCPSRASSLLSLEQHHITKHSREKRYRCDLCTFRSHRKHFVNAHRLMHTSKQQFGCDLCPYISITKNYLNRHKLLHWSFMPLVCEICPHKCFTESELIIHTLKHTPKEHFDCDHCLFTTNLKKNLIKHMATHYSTFKCFPCVFNANHKDELLQHITTHSSNFSCKQCLFTSIHKRQYVRHMKKNHSIFTCNQCSYTSNKYNELSQHIKKHSSFNCGQYSFTSYQEDKLRPLPFSCDQCSFSSYQKDELSQHIITHSTALSCDQCSFVCDAKIFLTKHKLSHGK